MSRPASATFSETTTLALSRQTTAEKNATNKSETPNKLESPTPEQNYPEGVRLALIALGLGLSVFLVALDQTIIAPATATITNQFGSLQDVGWYGSAYLLTSTAFQPLAGRLYAMLSLKWVFLSFIVIFEVGSLISAIATSSPMFIVGRAIAGLGLAGGYIGVLVIISASLPLHRRALATAFVGATYGAGAISGPIIGGALTNNVSWRWCFYLNLPVGAVTIALIVLFFNPPKRPAIEGGIKKRIAKLDWIGTVLFTGAVICILLALQDGGVKHAWNSSIIIGELVGFALLFIAFWVVQWYLGDRATIPLSILKKRTIWSGSIHNFAIGATYFTLAYFLPIYFQAVRGSGSMNAGIKTIPLIVSTIISNITVAVLVTGLDVIPPFMMICSAVIMIGSGLLYTLGVDSSSGKWIGYQILAGAGIGGSFQLAYLAAQTVLNGNEAELGSAIVIFFQTLGGCLFVSIAQSIYQNKFIGGISSIEGLDISSIISGGVTAFRETAPAEFLPAITEAAAVAIDDAFVCAIALAGVAFVSSFFVEWRSLKGQNVQMGGAA